MRIVKMVLSVLLLIFHIAALAWAEAFCASTLIWFVDWNITVNGFLVLQTTMFLVVHYLLLHFGVKRGLLTAWINTALRIAETAICSVILVLLLLSPFLLSRLPLGQYLFIVALQVIILISRMAYVKRF